MEQTDIGKILVRVLIRVLTLGVCCGLFFIPAATIKLKNVGNSAIAILFINIIIPFICVSFMGQGGPYDYLSSSIENKLI